jgi:hypothetical protein
MFQCFLLYGTRNQRGQRSPIFLFLNRVYIRLVGFLARGGGGGRPTVRTISTQDNTNTNKLQKHTYDPRSRLEPYNTADYLDCAAVHFSWAKVRFNHLHDNYRPCFYWAAEAGLLPLQVAAPATVQVSNPCVFWPVGRFSQMGTNVFEESPASIPWRQTWNSFETSVSVYQTTWRRLPQDWNLDGTCSSHVFKQRWNSVHF